MVITQAVSRAFGDFTKIIDYVGDTIIHSNNTDRVTGLGILDDSRNSNRDLLLGPLFGGQIRVRDKNVIVSDSSCFHRTNRED